MKDKTGKTIQVGDKVRFYHDKHRGTVVGFEQEGTVHQNVLIRNREIGYQVEGHRIANAWPYQVRVTGER